MRPMLLFLVLVTAFVVPRSTPAHEGHAHKVMGTVASVSEDGKTLEVTDKEGKTVRLAVTADTKFLKGDKTVKAADLQPGTRVVVSLKENTGGPATALEVRLADTAPDESAVSYTCPMHPEVRATAPGKCPKCGMNLEKTR